MSRYTRGHFQSFPTEFIKNQRFQESDIFSRTPQKPQPRETVRLQQTNVWRVYWAQESLSSQLPSILFHTIFYTEI